MNKPAIVIHKAGTPGPACSACNKEAQITINITNPVDEWCEVLHLCTEHAHAMRGLGQVLEGKTDFFSYGE